MIKYFVIFLFLIFSHCSFDTKSGIWKGEKTNSKQIDQFKGFKDLITGEQIFSKIINPTKNLRIKLSPVKNVLKWNDQYFDKKNNLNNFKYDFSNQIVFKSKKLSKSKVNNRILYDGEKVILTNEKGDVIFYSLKEEKIIFKYNFYKKKFKKLKKKLVIINDNDILYVADNIGYIYAINPSSKKVIWAKNYKVPFRSNIKIKNNSIFISNQNNILYKINKINGEELSLLPTEETVLKNDFINSLAFNDQSLFYLNTYGSLYAIQEENFKLKWFVNLNRSINLNTTELFNSKFIILTKNKIVISTDPHLYILSSVNGERLFKKPIPSITNIIVSNQNLFLITKNNLLVCVDMSNGEIKYSVNLDEKIAKFLDTKKKTIKAKYLSLVNNNLIIFLENSYTIKLTAKGQIKNIEKIKEKMKTRPIFINNSLMFLNKKNKLIVLN